MVEASENSSAALATGVGVLPACALGFLECEEVEVLDALLQLRGGELEFARDVVVDELVRQHPHELLLADGVAVVVSGVDFNLGHVGYRTWG